MKTKLFLAAVAVAFSFAVTSCGNKPASSEVSAESVEVETVEAAAPCCKSDYLIQMGVKHKSCFAPICVL